MDVAERTHTGLIDAQGALPSGGDES